MDSSTAHIVALPQYIFFLRIATTVLSIIVLGLAANTLNVFADGNSVLLRASGLDGVAFTVFAVVWTWLVNAYLIITPLWVPVAYNMWAQLFGDLTACIFWLAGFASCADWASTWADELSGKHDDEIGFGYKTPKKVKNAWGSAAGAAGLGAIMWIMFCVILVVFCIALHRHRTDPSNANLSPMGFSAAEKDHEMGHVQQGVPQQYPQQAQTPVYPQVQPTPPPQQWQQSPPPGQYPPQ